MADNKKYYYMRLNENYFDSETQVLLESMPDGYLYSNILMKLYLKSLKNDGKLMFNEKIPYSPQMIATITRHQIGTVEKALKIFRELNIIDIIDTGAIYMLDIQNYIGKSNTEADRKRAYRKKIEMEKGQMSLKCPLEIEIEKEIEKDIYNSPNEILDKSDEVPKKKKCFGNTEYSEESLKSNFQIIWDEYPRKEGKTEAFGSYIKYLSSKGKNINGIHYKLTNEQMLKAVEKYRDEKKGTEKCYIKQGSTFFNKDILDYIEDED